MGNKNHGPQQVGEVRKSLEKSTWFVVSWTTLSRYIFLQPNLCYVETEEATDLAQELRVYSDQLNAFQSTSCF